MDKSLEGWSIKKIVIVELITLALVLGAALLWTLRPLLLEVLVSLVLAVVAEPLIKGLIRLRLHRSVAVLIVFVLILGLISVIVFFLTEPIYHGIVSIVDRMPYIVRSIEAKKGRIGAIVTKLHLQSYLQSSAAKIAQLLPSAANPALGAAKSIVATLFNIVAIFILSVFLSLEGPVIVDGILSLLPQQRRQVVREALRDTAKGVTRYVLGNLLTSVLGGVIVATALSILGVSYAPILGIWVGIVDLLPLVGGLLAGIPTVLIALFHSTFAGIIMLVIFVAYQQIENHILNPLVFSKAVSLNPLWILLAILIGDQLAHLEGALLAIPVASGLQVAGKAIWLERARTQDQNITPEQEVPPGLTSGGDGIQPD